jgi:hypothetical protein
VSFFHLTEQEITAMTIHTSTKSLPLIAVFTLLTTLFGCTAANNSPPTINTTGEAKNFNGSTLYPVDHPIANVAYMDPNADFKKYTSIYILPLSLNQMQIIQPTIAPGNSPFSLTADNRELMKSTFAKVMTEQLSQLQGLNIVNTPNANTLIIQTAILQLRPAATNQANQDPSSIMFTSSTGGMMVGVALLDGGTGKTIAIADESYQGMNTAQWVNNTSGLRNLTLGFNRLGTQLRNRLDQLILGQ